jgi:glycosyltransferase involved in cell wall biosynthesis
MTGLTIMNLSLKNEKTAIRAQGVVTRKSMHTMVGVIYHRLTFLTIGTVIAATRQYVDKVYLIANGDDPRVIAIAHALDVEVIDKAATPYVKLFRDILSRDNSDILIALYGDGTHDTGRIPELVDSIHGGFDAVISPAREHEHGINEIVFYLNNKRLKSDNTGIIACSSKCFDHLKADFVMDVRHNLPGQFISKLEMAGLNVKHLRAASDNNQDLFSLYRIAVVVPAFNEEALIAETLQGIPGYIHRIYAIDDASQDRTWDIIKSMDDPRIVPIRHEKNKGVGAVIVTGYRKALEDNMDIVAVMAGDNQMDPGQLPRLLMPIIRGRADYTKGNRLISKDFRKGMSKWRSFGNFLLTMLTKIASGDWQIMDPQNGYTAISRQALEALDLDSVYTYYGYCNDLLIKLNAYGMRAMDIIMPSRYGQERSKILYSKYILKVSPMLFRGFLWRLKTKYILLDFNPLVLFYAVSMIMVPFGVLFCIWILLQKVLGYPVSQNFPLLAAFITLIGMQFLMFAMLFDMQADKSRSEIN